MQHGFGAATLRQFIFEAHAQQFAQAPCAGRGILFDGRVRLFWLSIFQRRPPHIQFFVENRRRATHELLK